MVLSLFRLFGLSVCDINKAVGKHLSDYNNTISSERTTNHLSKIH